jgi:secondary thiamine-phosphate synthase enzyme
MSSSNPARGILDHFQHAIETAHSAEIRISTQFSDASYMIKHLRIPTSAQGMHEFTAQVEQLVRESGVQAGLCTLFVRHTSASLIIQENADPSAKRDLERWLNRLVPENDPLYTHQNEGPDDMPAHLKAALTATSLSIPIDGGKLALGTWQGIYLFEHRHRGGAREVVVHIVP